MSILHKNTPMRDAIFYIKSKLSERYIPYLIFFAAALAYVWPIFSNFDYWGIQDWDFFFFLYEVPLKTIFDFRQIPLWNPYMRGGLPLLAHPESIYMTPWFLFTMIFGAVKGVKIVIPIHVFISLFGVYKLGGLIGLKGIGRYFATFVFALCAMFSIKLTAGSPNSLPMAYMPWILYFQMKAFDNSRYVVAISAILAVTFLSSGTYLFVFQLMMIGLFFILNINRGIKRVSFLMGAILILSSALSAIKLIPSIEFITFYPRHITDDSGYSLKIFWHMLIDRNQRMADIFRYIGGSGFWDGMTDHMDENSMYIGIIPMALFVSGFIAFFREKWKLACMFLFFLWLGFGYRCPVSLWALLHKIPILSFLRDTTRFHMVFMLFIALFSGLGLQALSEVLSKRIKKEITVKIILILITVFVCFDMMSVSWGIWKEAFQIPPQAINLGNKDFVQIPYLMPYDKTGYSIDKKEPAHYTYGTLSAKYIAFLNNMGTVYAYEGLEGVPKNAIPNNSPQYKGEVFLVDSPGKAAYKMWSPNRLIIESNAEKEAVLVINQNYYPGWHVNADFDAKLHSWRGLLAVIVPAGPNSVELYYSPLSFLIGLWVNILGLAAAVFWLTYFRKNKI